MQRSVVFTEVEDWSLGLEVLDPRISASWSASSILHLRYILV